MSSKFIAVWGNKNSGKTTFAVNLACVLAKRGYLTGVISSNLSYGELQVFYRQIVPMEKGLFRALEENNPNIGEKFVEYEACKNVFFLSVPTHYTGLLCDCITLSHAERMLMDASLVFDILILDGAGAINNPVSDTGLWLSERIYTIHKPSISAQLWYKGMEDFQKELRITEKQTHILLEPDGAFDSRAFRAGMDLSFSYELPFVKRAPELENAGRPICLEAAGACRRYTKVLANVANEICGGTKK